MARCGSVHRAADGVKSWITGSRLLQFLAKKSWLLLFVLGAYPFIDFVTRRFSESPGGLAGTWDELCLLLGLSLIAARALYNGFESYRLSEVHLPLLVYYGVFLFLFFLRSPETAVGIEGVRVYLEYVLWFFVGLNLPDSYRQVKSFTGFFVLVCAAVALYGIGQYAAGVPVPQNWLDQAEAGVRTRAFSVIGSPNVLGSLLALALPMSIAGFYTGGSRLSRTGYAVASAAMSVCLVVTFSRGAWFAAFLGLALFAVLVRPRLLWGLGATVLLAPVVSPGIAGRLLYLFSASYLASSERSGRIARWQAALQKLQQHPVSGEGFGRFGGAVATRAIPGSFYVDNFYLKTAAEGGVLALLTLLWVLFSAWRAGYRAVTVLSRPAVKTLAAAYLGGLTAVLLHNAVENIFETPLMSTLFWLFLGLLLALPRLASERWEV
ncbi:MAG: O-antigen ligase family protein [Bacillota bacterium]